MRHNKCTKILYIVIITILISCSLFNCCSATVVVDPNYDISETSVDSRIFSLAGFILGAVRTIGTILSVLILATIGIEYMLASPEGKADYKKNMYPYIVGAVLLFAGSNIPQLIYIAIR